MSEVKQDLSIETKLDRLRRQKREWYARNKPVQRAKSRQAYAIRYSKIRIWCSVCDCTYVRTYDRQHRSTIKHISAV